MTSFSEVFFCEFYNPKEFKVDLFLIEKKTNTTDKNELANLVTSLAETIAQAGGSPVEFFFGEQLQIVYGVSEANSKIILEAGLTKAGIPYDDVSPVRIVGATIDEVRERASEANYLVEWDLPAELTMDTYLQRKKEKSPLYANVPETTFLRTYVREDMVKCLCLYDAPDDDAVKRAREAVSTPIDRLTKIGNINND